MDNAIKVLSREYALQSRSVSNVCFCKSIAGISEVGSDVLAFDRRVVKIIKVVNNSDLPFVRGQQMIDKV